MILFLLFSCGLGSDLINKTDVKAIQPSEIQNKVNNIGERNWYYPSTGLILGFQEDNLQFIAAKKALKDEEFKKSATIMIELLESEPENAAYHSFLSSVMLTMGDVKQAKIAALKSVELQPSALSYVNLASVYQANNEFALAEENFEKAYQSSPKFFLPLRNLSSLRYTAGDLKGSERYLRALLRIDPDDSYVYVSLAEVLVEQKRTEEAKEVLMYRIQELTWLPKEEQLIDSGMILDLPLALGELYRRAQDWERAAYWFEQTIIQSEEFRSSMQNELQYRIEAELRLVEMYWSLGDIEKVELHLKRTNVYLQEGETDPSLTLYKETDRFERWETKLNQLKQKK